MVSPDSKPFDSHTDSKPETHHGEAAKKFPPVWFTFQGWLRTQLTAEEWNLWVKPMRLQKVQSGNNLLAGLPPNGKIIDAAYKRLPLMREFLTPAGFDIHFTRYVDEYELDESKRRYGIDMAPFTRKGNA